MANQTENKFNVLETQPTIEKPYLVEDYPYGFRLRCKIRYYVETTKSGQRFVSQTLNPKTNTWNKPKKSTYQNILLVGLDEINHVTYIGLYPGSEKTITEFSNKYSKYLSDWQKNEIINLSKMYQVIDKIQWKVTVQKYKDTRTGKILDKVNCFDIPYCIPVNDLGDVIDQKAEDAIEKEDNRNLNKSIILNAAKATNIKSAIQTFKRIR